VYAGFTPAETRRALKRKTEPSYMGTFTGARKYVLHTFATTHSALMKKRVARYMVGGLCPVCHGKRLRPAALSVKFEGYDISEISQMTLGRLAEALKPAAAGRFVKAAAQLTEESVSPRSELRGQCSSACHPGLTGTRLSLARSKYSDLVTGELQRLRLATQIRSNLFGVVYVLDEPSAVHPADGGILAEGLGQLQQSGNSVFVVEHDLEVMRRADWIVDVGPDAGELGGHVLYSGPPEGLRTVEASKTAQYLFAERDLPPRRVARRQLVAAPGSGSCPNSAATTQRRLLTRRFADDAGYAR